MNFFFGMLQLFGWVMFGWFLNDGNFWACVACFMFAVLSGLAITMNAVGKVLQNGTANQSK